MLMTLGTGGETPPAPDPVESIVLSRSIYLVRVEQEGAVPPALLFLGAAAAAAPGVAPAAVALVVEEERPVVPKRNAEDSCKYRNRH